MSKYSVCFWLNTKSNHQNEFLKELNKSEDVDLEVRYISKPSKNRIDIGWGNQNLEIYEKNVLTFEEAKNSLNDINSRIHIISGNYVTFSSQLIDYFVKNNLKWIHWSERYGISLAAKLKFNVTLFNLLRPIYLLTKLSYGKLVSNHALGCFSQGYLAEKDFKYIGIKQKKIKDLYYTSKVNDKCITIKDISNDTVKFLYVGELSIRKGIEELIKACSNLKNFNWNLTLVGADKSNGYFEKLCNNLNLDNKVNFIGVVPNSEVSSFYKNSDVFVFPSRFDGWGAVLNEAVSFSLPIISTNETGSSFTLIKDNGFIVKAGNISELAFSMNKYLDNHNLIIEHSENSKKLSKICTAEANVERFIDAFDKWIKG